MIHQPIRLKNIAYSLPHKSCFEDFTACITHSNRIAIIGRNGSGKSTLLRMIQGKLKPTSGNIIIPKDVSIGYVPQLIDEYSSLSGAQRFNKALTHALSNNPNILLLDEPTNHLDSANRSTLFRMLDSYQETLLVVSHDVALLRNCVTTFWHIENGVIHEFVGDYDNYIKESQLQRKSIEVELAQLRRQKYAMHDSLMKEQVRAKKSRQQGKKSIENKKWATIVSHAKARQSEETSGQKKRQIIAKKEKLHKQIAELQLPDIIVPTFNLQGTKPRKQTLITIREGSAGYEQPIIQNINLSLMGDERLAIVGKNGTGKSTLLKAILQDPAVQRSGTWLCPKPSDIGYLDQHYGWLDNSQTVLEILENSVNWPMAQIRQHLADFLFRQNEEVNMQVSMLSGGEKARLSLACIAAKTPSLLILDELTNNLDIETRAHIIQILEKYPGAILAVSHDKDFLENIGIPSTAYLENEQFGHTFLSMR